jgi:hypothetical protein
MTTWRELGYDTITIMDKQNGYINVITTTSNNINKASDATPLDPGGAVSEADSSASEGIMVDDPASIRLTNFSITVPLVGDRVACPVCEEKGINLFFMSLSDLNRHLDLHHTDTNIKWSCFCGKSFPKLHGALNAPALIKEKRENINAKHVS